MKYRQDAVATATPPDTPNNAIEGIFSGFLDTDQVGKYRNIAANSVDDINRPCCYLDADNSALSMDYPFLSVNLA
jgi:hypothetical protein